MFADACLCRAIIGPKVDLVAMRKQAAVDNALSGAASANNTSSCPNTPSCAPGLAQNRGSNDAEDSLMHEHQLQARAQHHGDESSAVKHVHGARVMPVKDPLDTLPSGGGSGCGNGVGSGGCGVGGSWSKSRQASAAAALQEPLNTFLSAGADDHGTRSGMDMMQVRTWGQAACAVGLTGHGCPCLYWHLLPSIHPLAPVHCTCDEPTGCDH